MKPHVITPALLLAAATFALGLTSCEVPVGYSNRGYSSYGNGIYNTLPLGYSGSAYYHNNRYYSGGRYQQGNFNYQGHSYNGRYQHGNGQYLYGGQQQHHGKSTFSGRGSHPSFQPSHSSAGFFPGRSHS
jgi:hypothetical protein